jgi:hypothetical protein
VREIGYIGLLEKSSPSWFASRDNERVPKTFLNNKDDTRIAIEVMDDA